MQFVKAIYLVCFFLLLAEVLPAQERYIRKGDEATAANNYVEAVEYYHEALPAVREKGDPLVVQDLLYKIGDAYLKMNQFGKALPWLSDAVNLGIYSEKIYLAYAETLTLNARVDEARKVYKEIWTRSGNTAARRKAEVLSGYDYHSKHFVNIRNELKLNSKFSDYSPARFGDKLVFSSARPGKKGLKNKRTAQGYSNLYEAVYNPNMAGYENIRPLSNKINTRKSEGVFTYSEASGSAFWMQCLENNTDCRIMTASFKGGQWDTPREISPSFNASEGHPAISKKGVTLYFVSDMEGGYGGKDIWKMQQVDGYKWTLPQNLGSEVNSRFDELFPAVFGDSLLVFASDRPDSYGGLDIYYTTLAQGQVQQIRHPGYPFNTVRDDFGVLLHKDGGLFSSNRNNIAQSDDIFSFDGFFDLIYVKGKVTDKETGAAISGVSIDLHFKNHDEQLDAGEEGSFIFKVAKGDPFQINTEVATYRSYEKAVSGKMLNQLDNNDTLILNIALVAEQPLAAIQGKVTSRESGTPMPGEQLSLTGETVSNDVATTDSKGMYAFNDILPGKKYEIKIAKEGYFSESRTLVIPALEAPTIFSSATGYDTDFQLTKIQKEKEVVINNIFYDFNKASLRPESKKELNKLVSMLKETPNVIMQINSHTDARGSNSYNKRLSQRRAQKVVDYLTANGIPSDRLFARGYGEKQLMVINATTETQHQLNRRTAFKVLAVLAGNKADTPTAVDEKESTSIPETIVNKSKERRIPPTDLIYRVQVMASGQRLSEARFRKLTGNIPDASLYVEENGAVYKYEIGERASYDEAVQLREQIVALGHTDCFITAYHQGRRISVKDALKQEKE